MKMFEYELLLSTALLLAISIISCYLTMIIHEFGHYLAARAFHHEAHITWGWSVSRVTHYTPNGTNMLHDCIISFAGILGILAIIPLWLSSQITFPPQSLLNQADIEAIIYGLLSFNLFYSPYETISRYRKILLARKGVKTI